MSLESATQRMSELQAMLAPAPAATSTTAAADPQANAAFAAKLALARSQNGSMPSSSMATAYPTLTDANGQLAQSGALPLYGASTIGSFNGSIAGGSAGARIVAFAQQEVGTSEQPPGSNDGARIRTYRTATRGAANTPGPWCGYFASWVCNQAGVPIGPGGSGFGYVPAIEQWGKQTNRYFSHALPQPGDIAIFERNGDGIADHTGVVESVDANGTIHTIEGNTGGGSVLRRSYQPSEISGFVRPG